MRIFSSDFFMEWRTCCLAPPSVIPNPLTYLMRTLPRLVRTSTAYLFMDTFYRGALSGLCDIQGLSEPRAPQMAQPSRMLRRLDTDFVTVGPPGVVVCGDHRRAQWCHRDHETGRCICR